MFGGRFIKQTVLPFLLLDELLPQFFTTGATELDIDETGTDVLHIETLLHHITTRYALSTRTLEARFHR